jgi:hypothetical protein
VGSGEPGYRRAKKNKKRSGSSGDNKLGAYLDWRAEAEEHKDSTYVSQLLDLTDEYKSLCFSEI